jgi:hypothetical protein
MAVDANKQQKEPNERKELYDLSNAEEVKAETKIHFQLLENCLRKILILV